MTNDDWEGEERSSSGLLILVTAVALLLAAGGVVWMYMLQNRLDSLQTRVDQWQEHSVELAAQQSEMRRQMRAATETFGAKVGITQQQIEVRAQEILRQQQTENNHLAALMSRQEAATRKQVRSVSNAVSGVRTDVGGVKQDVASTRKELAATEQQLHAAIGDMGIQSGLIAKNAQQLNYLKHLGDRRYFAFTLHKNRPPTSISTIKLRLRKADRKHSRYTLEIFSDDARIEKKNRDLDAPLQFYSGKPPLLFEIVVNQIGKNQVSGYLSTPMAAPLPAAVP